MIKSNLLASWSAAPVLSPVWNHHEVFQLLSKFDVFTWAAVQKNKKTLMYYTSVF